MTGHAPLAVTISQRETKVKSVLAHVMTPGLLASYSHIHIQIIWTRELSEPLTFREVQRVLWSKKSESEYEYLLLTTLGYVMTKRAL